MFTQPAICETIDICCPLYDPLASAQTFRKLTNNSQADTPPTTTKAPVAAGRGMANF